MITEDKNYSFYLWADVILKRRTSLNLRPGPFPATALAVSAYQAVCGNLFQYTPGQFISPDPLSTYHIRLLVYHVYAPKFFSVLSRLRVYRKSHKQKQREHFVIGTPCEVY